MSNTDVTSPKQPTKPHPFWWPDTRGWITIGMFILAAFIMYCVVFQKEAVKDNQLFAQLATGIVMSCLTGTIITFYMGSSKNGQETSSKMADTITNTNGTPNVSVNPQPGAVTTTTTTTDATQLERHPDDADPRT